MVVKLRLQIRCENVIGLVRAPSCAQQHARGGKHVAQIVFRKVISGLRKPIAIQATISLNIPLPE
jgi:hypothetical protein